MLKTHRQIILTLSVIILFIAILILSNCRRAPEAFSKIALASAPQNAMVFVDPKNGKQLLIATATQQQLSNIYLMRYFSPWTKNYLIYSPFVKTPIHNLNDVKTLENHYAQEFMEDPGYGMNRLKNSEEWVKTIVNNMNMTTFPNQQRRAITILPDNMRILPTNDFSFDNWHNAGEGYPFDYLQESSVHANTPALILQTSLDGAWDLVLTHDDLGWMQARNLAFVDDRFVSDWQTGKYVTPIKDQVPLRDAAQQFYLMANIGTIYPVAKSANITDNLPTANANGYAILIAVPDSNNQAVIKTVNMSSQDAAVWPLPITQYNIAEIINPMLGEYYGWGGLDGYRDCSATMMNLFATFGFWLPRNSEDQFLSGNDDSLENLNARKKIQMIAVRGVPFLTLLKLPGHIVLYLGEKSGQTYVFQEFWGLHTENFFGQPGRAIVGKAAITPLTLGEGYINVPQRDIDMVQGMTTLGTDLLPSVNPKHKDYNQIKRKPEPH